jgi:hypothetical protein
MRLSLARAVLRFSLDLAHGVRDGTVSLDEATRIGNEVILSEAVTPRNFYGRPKKPWVGFLLVLLLGPFGFLYHSWKTALVLLFVILPLWIIFLRRTAAHSRRNPVVDLPCRRAHLT